MNPIIGKRFKRIGSSLWNWLNHKIGFIIQIFVWSAIFYILISPLANLYLQIFPDNKNVSLGDFILILTAALLFIYTYETQQSRQELVTQNEIGQMPIMVLYIREVADFGYNAEELMKYRRRGFGIERRTDVGPAKYAFRLKNVGKGPAFNVRISSNKFGAEKFEERFFAPMDEHSVRILRQRKGSDRMVMIESFEEFKNSTLTICCESLTGKEYFFDYKIVDIEEKRVEFIGKDKI